MKHFFFDCGPRDATTSLGLLILRVGTGLLMLFGHGLSKLQGFAEKSKGFPAPDFFPLKYMSSPISMGATIFAEVFCAGLLVLGLATRPAAFVLAFTMTVAAFNIHAADPLFMSGGGASKEPAILFLLPCLALLLSGAGSISADGLILKERRRSW